MSKVEIYASTLGVSAMTIHRYAAEAGSWKLADIRRVAKKRLQYRMGDSKRRAKAAQLRDSGLTWNEVGERLGGISGSCACHLAARHKKLS